MHRECAYLPRSAHTSTSYNKKRRLLCTRAASRTPCRETTIHANTHTHAHTHAHAHTQVTLLHSPVLQVPGMQQTSCCNAARIPLECSWHCSKHPHPHPHPHPQNHTHTTTPTPTLTHTTTLTTTPTHPHSHPHPSNTMFQQGTERVCLKHGVYGKRVRELCAFASAHCLAFCIHSRLQTYPAFSFFSHNLKESGSLCDFCCFL